MLSVSHAAAGTSFAGSPTSGAAFTVIEQAADGVGKVLSLEIGTILRSELLCTVLHFGIFFWKCHPLSAYWQHTGGDISKIRPKSSTVLQWQPSAVVHGLPDYVQSRSHTFAAAS